MFRFGKKKKQAQEEKKQQSPAADVDEAYYDQWIDHTKSNDPVYEGAYENDGDNPVYEGAYENDGDNPRVEDEYDDWGTSDHHLQKPGQPPVVEDLYDEFTETKEDVSNQEYEEVEEEGDIFGFDSKKATYVNTTSPGWANKPRAPPVKGTQLTTKKPISAQLPQDEYEDVTGEGDIFGFDKKATYVNTPAPQWGNKPPPVKGAPPSTRKPVSAQQPPSLPKTKPPSQRPKSVQTPTYTNVNEPTPYEMPQNSSYVNANRQDEGESYEEMEGLDLKPTYVNVTSQDIGGESYEEVDRLDIKKGPPGAENVEYYEDILPDNEVPKPQVTVSIAERQQQLQKKETKEPPKKRGLAADYQKMKFEMLAQKFKEIDSGEAKSEPAKTTSDKKKTWPPKSGANDEATPAKGTVTSLTRGFQGPGANKPKDKANMKGLLWHKAPGRNKYHEEHCELDGSNLKLFRNKNDPNPYFTINTMQCHLAPAPEEYEKKNVFKLTAGASRDYFGAFNAGEMKAWMNALRPVVKTAK